MKEYILKMMLCLMTLPVTYIANAQFSRTRTAILTDKEGINSEVVVTGTLPCYKMRYITASNKNSFYLFTPTFEYSIPIENVISLKLTDKFIHISYPMTSKPVYAIEYVLGGKKLKIEGSLSASSASKNILQVMYGSSKAEIDMDSIAELIFKDDPVELNSNPINGNNITFKFLLSDSTKVDVHDLHFHQETYSTEGYISGGEYIQNFYEYMPILKGALKLEINFKDISSLKLFPIKNDLSPDWSSGFICKYSLLNKSRDEGKLENIYEFSGFSGITEYGPFFIEVRKVKAITQL